MTDLKNILPLKKFKILLIGDRCLDIYQYGNIDRLSPEAPIPVFVPSYKEERAGMAGNVHTNLLQFGCDVDLVADKQSVKTRLIDIRSKQQIVRIDEDVKSKPITNIDAKNYDAVVISDYNKGFVSNDLIHSIIQQSNHGVNFPVFIDTKKIDLELMQGAWVKINELEYSKIRSECTGLIITKGSNGASVPHHNFECPAPSVEVVDVTGAGDTFLAALTYAYLQTKDIKEAVMFANKAASITVQRLGVYAPTLEEIK